MYKVTHRGLQRSESCRKDEQRSKKVKLKRKSFSFRMSEGRKTQVILLDDRRLDLLVQPKLYATELLDIVASHFNLKEKEYFGLSFRDETGHHHWLHLDRKVLEHDLPKRTGPLVLYFGIRFFIESIGYLRDNATIELFYLQAKQAIFKGHLEIDPETAFELAAHVLQAGFADYTDDEAAKKYLKKLPVIPTSVLREHPSIEFCEEQVLAHYRKLEGHTRGSAIVNYMTIIESIPTYGIHFYEVKDKSSIPWWLGLSYKGISLYDYADKRVPRRVFAWKQLENLYFRDKKFSIEVHDPKRIVHTLSSFNLYEDAIQEPLEEFDDLSDAISDPTTQVSVSRRTFGPGNVNVHAWFASTPQLTKCIWSMAVSQHQFYLDRKQSKSQLVQVRSMSEIATDLSHSQSSLHSSAATSDGISRSNSAHSLTLSTYNSRTELTAEDIESSQALQREMFHALQARKEALEEALRKKTEELKALCLKEGELTGVLPPETPLVPGEPLPHIRRRVGTSFTLSPKIMRDKATETEEALAKLELDLELQQKISTAAYNLAQDKSVAKSVRKQRKQQYQRAHLRLKDIEQKLNEFKKRIGQLPVKIQSSMEDLSEDSREFLDSDADFISPIGSPSPLRTDREDNYQHQYSNHYHGNHQPLRQQSSASVGQPQHKSAPASPVRQPQGAPRINTPSPNPGRHPSGGYITNSVYATRTQYRNQTYPTYSSKDSPSGASGSLSDYENSASRTTTQPPNRHVSRIDRENLRNEKVHNLYNINANKTACYDSTDELKSPGSEEYDSYYSDQEVGGGRWHGRNYGSLDRNIAPNMMMTELSPSKFGSKRESHSDQQDSPYQIVDMPPTPQMSSQMRETTAAMYNHQYEQRGSVLRDTPSHDNSPHNTSIPYIDCSQSTISVASSGSGNQWYDSNKDPRYNPQQPPQGYDPAAQKHTDSQYQNPPSRGQQNRNQVTKYHQSYVEVSKPFEMSDFYKYSERLRRQRVHESPPPGSVSSPQSPHHQYPQPPQSSRNTPATTTRGQQYSSTTTSRSRPSSPYHGTYPPHHESSHSKHSSSPYSSTGGAPSNLGQSLGYAPPPPPVANYSTTPVDQHSSPTHAAYKPPKPMTCDPVRDSPAHGKVSHRQV